MYLQRPAADCLVQQVGTSLSRRWGRGVPCLEHISLLAQEGAARPERRMASVAVCRETVAPGAHIHELNATVDVLTDAEVDVVRRLRPADGGEPAGGDHIVVAAPPPAAGDTARAVELCALVGDETRLGVGESRKPATRCAGYLASRRVHRSSRSQIRALQAEAGDAFLGAT